MHRGTFDRDLVKVVVTRWHNGPGAEEIALTWDDLEVQVEVRDEPPFTMKEAWRVMARLAVILSELDATAGVPDPEPVSLVHLHREADRLLEEHQDDVTGLVAGLLRRAR